jgi:cell division protein FtsZ
MSLYEVNEAASLVQEEADDDANIIFGAVIDETLADEIRVTVIATGFGEYGLEPERRNSRHSLPGIPPAAPLKDVPSRPVELQSVASPSLPEPPPVPSGSQGNTSGGNGKPVRRLGLIDESSLDVPAFPRRNGGHGTANHNGQGGFEADDELG